MPTFLKNLLLLILRLAVVVLVWVLFSTFYPRMPFGKEFVTSTPVILTPTLEPIIIPPLQPTSTLIAEQSLTIQTTVTPLPVPYTALPTTRPMKPLEVIVDNTQKGTLLTVTGGLENYHYRLGPLAKGAYALGPNQNFLVYVANDGMVYINRLGETRFEVVKDVKRSFTAINKHVKPSFELSFHDTGYVYVLFIYEGRFGETVQVILPRLITNF